MWRNGSAVGVCVEAEYNNFYTLHNGLFNDFGQEIFCQMWRNGSAVGVCVEAEYNNFYTLHNGLF